MADAPPIHVAFGPEVIDLPLDALLPVRETTARTVATRKYARIAASVREIGLIEPLVVSAPVEDGRRLLLDGHLRMHVLSTLSAATAPCIVSDDDEAFTYNKRVNRLATVQEHYMIRRALDRGVPAEMIARALGVDVASVLRRRTMLDGIWPETVDLLKDRNVNPQAFDALRRMKQHKQAFAAELMCSSNNFTATYAKALLAGTRPDDLVKPDRPKRIRGLSPEQMARMERELETLNGSFRAVETTFGDDVLNLVLASRYVERLIRNDAVRTYVEKRHPEILAEFRTIVAASSLEA